VIRLSYLGRIPSFHKRLTVGKVAAGIAVVVGLSTIALPLKAQPKGQESVVRLAGSGTIGAKLALELATGWAKQLKLPGVRIDGGLDPDEYDVIAEGAESTQKMRVQVRAKGTGSGLEPLLRGQADIWMASRPVRESDLDAMRKRNVPNVPTLAQLQQPGVENVIGLAALAIIVNHRNPVPSLSVAQLREIFTGRVTSWAQVGGPSNTPIGIYSPEMGSGGADAFCTTIMGNGDTQKCLDAFPRLASPRFALLEDLSDGVASNPAGISFTDLSLRRSTRPVPLGTECGGSGIDPSLFRIKTDEYPLGRRLFLYTAPSRALSPAGRDFLQFAISPLGQVAVSGSGFADLSPGKADANYAGERQDSVRDALDGGRTRVRAPDVKAFEAAIAGADRISITFRFQSGTNTLDSRAEADVGRLVALMQTPAYSQSSLMLVGYSSTTGDYAENRILSRERAEAVRDRVLASGIQNVSSVGIGPGAAVACNLDPSTGPLNQRVEVWVRKPRAS
jgi:phosphate transport system substrate-binding protein